MEKKKKKIKVFDIVSWVLVILLFLTSALLLIFRKTDATSKIFNNRYDVVLSESMSRKNENHLDFLEGHDDQIQKMDLVKSKIVDKDTKLEVYDIVLFDNPWIKAVDMHRVVDIRELSVDEIGVYRCEQSEFHGYSTIKLTEFNGGIEIKNAKFSDITITFVSESPTFSDGYKYAFLTTYVDGAVQTKEVNGVYEHSVSVHRDSTSPIKFTVTHNKEFDYASERIARITFISERGDVDITGSDFYIVEDHLECKKNAVYEYEIRGDAAKTSDGWYTIDQIHSRVTKVYPKAGYFFRFINSLPGILLIIGLGVILILVDFFVDKFDKEEAKKEEVALESEHISDDKK